MSSPIPNDFSRSSTPIEFILEERKQQGLRDQEVEQESEEARSYESESPEEEATPLPLASPKSGSLNTPPSAASPLTHSSIISSDDAPRDKEQRTDE